MQTSMILLKTQLRTSLVVQWLRICLPKQGAQVQSLVRELRSHMPQGNWVWVGQLLSPCPLERACCNWRVQSESESCSVVSNFCDPMDSTVHRILQARILEWVPFPFSRGSSQPRDRIQVSHFAGTFFTSRATREAQGESPCTETKDFVCCN